MLILALPGPKHSAPQFFIHIEIDQVQTKFAKKSSVIWVLLNPLALTLIQHPCHILDSMNGTLSELFS